jgi:tetratricopeptide (TPR) repeat protein
VSDYLALREAPNVLDYSYEISLPDRSREEISRAGDANISEDLTREDVLADEVGDRDRGRLWAMPAGKRDETYSRLLQDIDWGLLYAEHNGYLMFEDMKEQWKQTFNPDYVLIDSRTGHTDVGGICTRHLPNTVVLLFFPNDQNLIGLEGVVRDIRDEAKPPHNKRIFLHFVMSNVPSLDDEDSILSDRRSEFERKLGFKRVLTIHHYSTLALLNQMIFCEDRPRSRLAREYRQVTQEIIRQNAGDKEGALIFLSRYAGERRRGTLSTLDADTMLDSIELEHAHDGDIQTHVAFLRMEEGAYEQAKRTLERAIDTTVSSPRTLARRAQCRLLLLKDEAGAEADAVRAVRHPTISEPDALRAFRIIAGLKGRTVLQEVAQQPTMKLLPAGVRLFVGTKLNRELAELPIAIEILRGVLEDPRIEERQRAEARVRLVCSSIGIGAFSDAVHLLQEDAAGNDADIAVAFNYAMARWALDGDDNRDLFQKVVDLDVRDSESDANYFQCMAIAYWIVGDFERAIQSLNRAESLIDNWEFSCWRYLEVSEEMFHDDLNAIRRMFSGGDLRPEFFAHNQKSPLSQRWLDS